MNVSFVSTTALVFQPSSKCNNFDSLCNIILIGAVLLKSTDPVELWEWLLLYNVQHYSLWFVQMEMPVVFHYYLKH